MQLIYFQSQKHQRVIEVTGLDTTVVAGDGTIKYVLQVDGTCYWYDTGWKQSSMAIAQGNTILDLIAQLATLPLNTVNGSDVKLIVINEYTTTPHTISFMSIESNTVEKIDPVPTRVKVDITSLGGEAVSGVAIQARLANLPTGVPIKYKNNFPQPSTITAYTNQYGEAILELLSNSYIEPMPNNIRYAISIGTIVTANYTIPPVWEVDLSTLLPS